MRKTSGFRTALAFAALVGLTLAVACGGGGGTEPDTRNLVVTPTTLTIPRGNSGQIGAAVVNGAGDTVSGASITFSSSVPRVASVNAAGAVQALDTIGATIITVSSGALHSTVPVTVSAFNPDPLGVVDSLYVAPDSLIVLQKLTAPVTVLLFDSHHAILNAVHPSFATGNTGLMTVNGTGTVSSVGPHGTTTLTVTAGALHKTIPVTVTQTPLSVNVTPDTVIVAQNGTVQLSAAVLDAVGDTIQGMGVTYTPSTPPLYTVSQTGLLTPTGPAGHGLLTVSAPNAGAFVPVTITPVPISLAVFPTAVKLPPGAAVQLRAIVTDLHGDPIANPSLTYDSDNAASATANATGRLTAGATLGTATMTVGSGGLSATTVVTVAARTHPSGNLQPTVFLGGTPWDVTVGTNGAVYVQGLGGRVTRFDLAGNPDTTSAAMAGDPAWIAVDHLSERVISSRILDGKFVQLDPLTLAVGGSGGTGFENEAVAFSQDDATLFVGTRGGKLQWINPATLASSGDIDLGTEFEPASLIFSLAFGPGGTTLYAAGADHVYEVNTATRVVTRSLLLPPAGIDVALDGSELYAAEEFGIGVRVINIATWSESAPILMPSGSFDVAVSPDGARLYVTLPGENGDDGQVIFVDVPSHAIVGSVGGLSYPRRVAFNAVGDVAVVTGEGGAVYFIK